MMALTGLELTTFCYQEVHDYSLDATAYLHHSQGLNVYTCTSLQVVHVHVHHIKPLDKNQM